MPIFQPNLDYGKIKNDFSLEYPERGYVSITGANNSGKTTILQHFFRQLPADPANCICYLPTNRVNTSGRLLGAGGTLTDVNQTLKQQLNNVSALNVDNNSNELVKNLISTLLRDVSLQRHAGRFIDVMESLGFPNIDTAQGDNIVDTNTGRLLTSQGGGQLAIATIVAAITHPKIDKLLIDEPELFLEPRLQKKVRALFEEQCDDKLIIVATHSHIFLNKSVLENNWVVSNSGEGLRVEPVRNEQEKLNVVFNLLGNNLSDLSIPENYIVVEGASDQKIIERILELKGSIGEVKVISAGGGASEVKRRISAIGNLATELITKDSPYKKRVVVLLDSVHEDQQGHLNDLKKELGSDRLKILNRSMIEEYLPMELYEKAGLNQEAELAKLRGASVEEANLIKKNISNSVSRIIELKDLDSIATLRDCVEAALNYKSTG